MSFPFVVIQTNLTFTAKRSGQSPTITFTNGASCAVVSATVSAIVISIVSGTTTMAQVKAAVEAASVVSSGFAANDLVAVTVTAGHETDVVVTCDAAPLAGGVAAAKASKTIGHLVYTAKATGTGGNSTRVKYTSGGSLTVTVSSQDITIQLKNDKSSTNALIKAAIAGDTGANALVDTASDGVALSYVPDTSAAADFVSLVGGVAAAAATVTVQNIVLTAGATGTALNGKTLSYTTGATAGAEVVTLDGSNNVSVQIENGVSTATQIAAAMNAVGASFGGIAATGSVTVADYTLCAGKTLTVNGISLVEGADWTAASDNTTTAASLSTALGAVTGIVRGRSGAGITITASATGSAGNSIGLVSDAGAGLTLSGATLTGGADALYATVTTTGTASNAQKTVNAAPLTGGAGPLVAGGALGFYQDNTGLTLTTTFQYQSFGNTMGAMSVYNDEVSGTKTVIWSYDGVNNHGSLLPTQSVQLLRVNKGGIYLKEANGAPAYRVFAAAQ